MDTKIPTYSSVAIGIFFITEIYMILANYIMMDERIISQIKNISGCHHVPHLPDDFNCWNSFTPSYEIKDRLIGMDIKI